MTVKTINVSLGGIGEGIGALTTTPFTVMAGDVVKFVGTVQHMGPAYSGVIYYAIGSKGVTFDEIWNNDGNSYTAISIPASASLASYTLPTINITITAVAGTIPATVAPGTYETYGKIAKNLGATTPLDIVEYGALDVITYVGGEHVFSGLNVTYSKV